MPSVIEAEETLSAKSSDEGFPEGGGVDVTDKNDHNEVIRKRKRKDVSEDLESSYMRRLAREEAREEELNRAERIAKRQKLEDGDSGASESEQLGLESGSDVEPIPVHEALEPHSDSAKVDNSSRTLFLGNVSTKAIKSKSVKKTLLAHLSSFLPNLGSNDPPHKIESFRFRSTAYSTSAMPKRGAFAKKELMDETTQSTNAYVVYSTDLAARKAALLLNGTVVLDRHLRVDNVAHPAPTDHTRCIFVGNLSFVDEESAEAQANPDEPAKRSKAKLPADAEEGLWRTFTTCGSVESVRVVRDKATRVGKGFAYVQFKDENGVEAALALNDKKFPPLLPRKLRISRAKRMKKGGSGNAQNPSKLSNGRTRTGLPPQSQSFQGNATRPSRPGRRGAENGTTGLNAAKGAPGSFKKPESFVFEGYRASSVGAKGMAPKKRKRNFGGTKPKTRSSRRGTAFKASGGKKKREA